jgi:uroporphyrinogen decarboxylase
MSAANVRSDNDNLERVVPGQGMTARDRFLAACRCGKVDRPPLWLMRQAGRALPEYRKLKEKHTFLELVQTPELAAEVTLQPVRRFGFDAAILFSDILVIPEAMGQPYHFPEGGGVLMDSPVRDRADIARLSADGVADRLDYVRRALGLIRPALGGKTALIGFAGSPWTLASFMLEGGSAPNFTRALALFHEDRKTFYTLAEKLTAAVISYLQMQVDAGVDAVQLFDTHGGLIPPGDFQEASGRWMKEIVAALRKPGKRQEADSAKELPAVIVFSLGTHSNWEDLSGTGVDVLGIDWRFPMSRARELVPATIALQGNLAPALLSEATAAGVAAKTTELLVEMRGRAGYICNLGHGVPPAAKLENIAALAETVRNFK